MNHKIKKKKTIIITGPTASGKSNIANQLSYILDGVIINSDSKQVYKEIPIITAQPHISESVKLMLYGHISNTSQYSVSTWLSDATKAIKTTLYENKTPIVTGGTGMYINALCCGLLNITNEQYQYLSLIRKTTEQMTKASLYNYISKIDWHTSQKIHQNDIHKIKKAIEIKLVTGKSIEENDRIKPFNQNDFITFIIMPKNRLHLYEIINQRVEQMIQNNVIDEIKTIYSTLTQNTKTPAYKTCGIPQIMDYLNHKISINECIMQIQQSTRNYAKKQYTWFKHQLQNGHLIDPNTKPIQQIIEILKDKL